MFHRSPLPRAPWQGMVSWNQSLGSICTILFLHVSCYIFCVSYLGQSRALQVGHFLAACWWPLPVSQYWPITIQSEMHCASMVRLAAANMRQWHWKTALTRDTSALSRVHNSASKPNAINPHPHPPTHTHTPQPTPPLPFPTDAVV